MTFSEVQSLVQSAGKEIYVLTGRNRQRKVLVCPQLAGRVLGTSFSGESGTFGGYINHRAFTEGMKDAWDNWGGEERYWLCPEGGQYGLMFRDKRESFSHYHVQDGINNQPYEVTEASPHGSFLRMRSRMRLQNKQGTNFDVEVARHISPLDNCPYANGCGSSVDVVGFQSESTLSNIGQIPFSRDTGALAHWHIGQFPVGKHTIAAIPYRASSSEDPPIREDYFKDFCLGGFMPRHHYSKLNNCVLLKADGRVRTKLGQNSSRAAGLLGSYNLETGEVVLMDYDFYPKLEYVASYWYHQPRPYHGDVISLSVEGPNEPGGPAGRCYELEAMSPALWLDPGESFTWRTRTMHLRGAKQTVAPIFERFLGPNLAQLELFDRVSSESPRTGPVHSNKNPVACST